MSDRFDAPLQKTPSLIEAVKRAFAKALVFSGRASRAEFWLFILFYVLVSVALIVIWSLIFGASVTTIQVTNANGSADGSFTQVSYSSGWLGTIFGLVCLIPGLSLAWRRLHDRDHAGWWVFVPAAVMLVVIPLTMIWAFGFTAFWNAVTGGTFLRYQFNSGFLVLAMFLALFAPPLYLFIHSVRAGTPGANRFGRPVYAEGAR